MMSFIFLLSLPLVALAEKDSGYYPGHFSNPNANRKMYWREGANVVQDLSQFSKLYITYHNCAWSPYGQDGAENPCGVQEAEDDAYWYMGFTECFRANAAFSLYGVLAGSSDERCTKKTFINSFFTTQGVEELTQAVEEAGFSFSSSTNNNDDEEEEAQENDNGLTSDCSAEDNASYGLACSATNTFVQKTFSDSYCSSGSAEATTDTLASFNEDLSSIQCFEIYDSSNGNNNDVLDLLTYSKSCSVAEYPRQCPDPFGQLRVYSSSMGRSTAKAAHPRREMAKKVFSWLLLIFGILMIIAVVNLVYDRVNRRSAKNAKNGRDGNTGRKRWFGSRGANEDKNASDEKASSSNNADNSKSTDGEKAQKNRPRFFKRFRMGRNNAKS